MPSQFFSIINDRQAKPKSPEISNHPSVAFPGLARKPQLGQRLRLSECDLGREPRHRGKQIPSGWLLKVGDTAWSTLSRRVLRCDRPDAPRGRFEVRLRAVRQSSRDLHGRFGTMNSRTPILIDASRLHHLLDPQAKAPVSCSTLGRWVRSRVDTAPVRRHDRVAGRRASWGQIGSSCDGTPTGRPDDSAYPVNIYGNDQPRVGKLGLVEPLSPSGDETCSERERVLGVPTLDDVGDSLATLSF